MLNSYFIFLKLSGTFLTQKQHNWLYKLFLMSKNSCKEYFVVWKQIKSTTAASSKLRMFGGKTCTRLDATDVIFYFSDEHPHLFL